MTLDGKAGNGASVLLMVVSELTFALCFLVPTAQDPNPVTAVSQPGLVCSEFSKVSSHGKQTPHRRAPWESQQSRRIPRLSLTPSRSSSRASFLPPVT